MSKLITKEEAVAKIHDGMTIMVGGFLVVGTPTLIIDELVKKGVKDITLIVNDAAFIDRGIGVLIAKKMVKKVITSYIGSNPACIEQYNNKELEVEFVPQGTLAERVRSAGAGLGGFLTPTGLGTVVEEGKQRISVDGKDYLLEKALKADIALIGASIADEEGNLFYKGTTQNFNPIMATAADIVIAEVDEVVKTGELPMENIHTPAIFVDYIVK
ncbi:MAG: CoA transferase subunit A [Bacteroidales bacterium]|nr:CoA transferase subunit A [Bacteroidales bacterium]